MGDIRTPKSVKLFIGMLSADRDLMRRARQLASRLFGTVDAESDYWPFEHTDYYREELGAGLERQFIFFADLRGPQEIAEIKRLTNDLEHRLCDDLALPRDRRPVNLDPGYMSLNKVVLATTKDFSHRIYLQRGIYAEVTLTFRDGRWQGWPWTYPDYACGRYGTFFEHMREKLQQQLAG